MRCGKRWSHPPPLKPNVHSPHDGPVSQSGRNHVQRLRQIGIVHSLLAHQYNDIGQNNTGLPFKKPACIVRIVKIGMFFQNNATGNRWQYTVKRRERNHCLGKCLQLYYFIYEFKTGNEAGYCGYTATNNYQALINCRVWYCWTISLYTEISRRLSPK